MNHFPNVQLPCSLPLHIHMFISHMVCRIAGEEEEHCQDNVLRFPRFFSPMVGDDGDNGMPKRSEMKVDNDAKSTKVKFKKRRVEHAFERFSVHSLRSCHVCHESVFGIFCLPP